PPFGGVVAAVAALDRVGDVPEKFEGHRPGSCRRRRHPRECGRRSREPGYNVEVLGNRDEVIGASAGGRGGATPLLGTLVVTESGRPAGSPAVGIAPPL